MSVLFCCGNEKHDSGAWHQCHGIGEDIWGMKKYVYRFACAFLMVAIATGMFEFVWIRFATAHNQTGHLLGLGNKLMVAALYAFVFTIFGRWLHAFKIGVERKAKIIASIVLTVLVTDFNEIFLSLVVTGQFRFFDEFLWRFALLAVVQSIILSLLAVPMVNIYRRIIPPLKLVEIMGEFNYIQI